MKFFFALALFGGALLAYPGASAHAGTFDEFCAQMGLSSSACMQQYQGNVPAAGTGPRYSYAQAQSLVQKLGTQTVCAPDPSVNAYEADIFNRVSSGGGFLSRVIRRAVRLSTTCQAEGYYLNLFKSLSQNGSQSFCVPSDANFSDLAIIASQNPNLKVDVTCSGNGPMSNQTQNVANTGYNQGITGSLELKDIDMPCVPGTSDSEIAANRERGGKLMKAFRACRDFLPELQRDVNGQIKYWADRFYAGCSYDPTSSNTVGSCQGTPVTGQVCNALVQAGVPSTFSPSTPETETNHLGNACGSWIGMNPHLEGRTCVLDTQMGNGLHQREDSYIRGARIQALNCKYNHVLNQVTRTQKVKLTYLLANTPAPVPGMCAAVSPNWRTATAQAEKMMSDVINGDPNQKLGFSQAQLLEDIDNCKDDAQAAADFRATVTDPGKHRQGACYIKGMRAAIEAMAKQLVACEVHYQSQLSYEQFLGAANQSASIDTVVRKLINGSVDSSLSESQSANASGILPTLSRYRKDRCTSSDPSSCSVTNVRDHCYVPAFMQVLQIRANDVWNQESCS